jgi:hypothetical protein
MSRNGADVNVKVNGKPINKENIAQFVFDDRCVGFRTELHLKSNGEVVSLTNFIASIEADEDGVIWFCLTSNLIDLK